MTFTYTGDPSASDVEAVRFEISDTDPNAPLLQDGEISYAILAETGVPAASPTVIVPPGLYSAAARCMEALARKFAMQADQEVGDLKTTWSKQAQTYAERAQELRAKAQGMHAPYAGGLSRAEKDTFRSDPDRVQPVFTRDQFTNPWSPPVDDVSELSPPAGEI